jgi:hypothetical protein
MSDEFEELLGSKEWTDLTDDERALALTHVQSESDYQAMRKITVALEGHPRARISPDKNILPVLKKRMAKQPAYPRWLVTAFGHKMPVHSVSTSIILALIVGWAIGSQQTVKPEVHERIVYQVDTVFQTLPSDTVFVSKVVYRYIPQSRPSRADFKTVNQENPPTESRGVTMKEKEELDVLIVSGTD